MRIKKNPKANLDRWSSVFFLFGLALMLSISYFALEWKSYENEQAVADQLVLEDDLEMDIPVTEQLNTPPPPPPPPSTALEVIEVIEDDLDIEETLIESAEIDQDSKIEIVEIHEIEEVEEEEEIVEVPFAVIEDVPIFPGCEERGSNDERESCFKEKIMEFVQRNFNTDLAGELGLEGKQRINVQFMIDQNGNVVNVRARAPHPRLELSAVELIKKLPKMTPGKQRGKPVRVLYSLPILFQVEDGSK